MLKDKLPLFISYGKKSIGFILFLICSFAIYKQVLSNENWSEQVTIFQSLFFTIPMYQWVLLLVLMGANFLTESIKWKWVASSNNSISLLHAIKSVLVGQTFAFFTPNRVGEFAGRTLFLQSGNKARGVAQFVWTSYAQLLITICIGSIALACNNTSYQWISVPIWTLFKWGSILMGPLCLALYFYQKKWTGKLQFLNIIPIETNLKIKLLLLSLVRYSIFMLQYIWVAKMLHMDITRIQLLSTISIMFLFLSILPTFSFAELAIRGQLLLLLLAPLHQHQLLILSLSSFIWVVNFLIPSIIGAFILLGYRINQ